MKENWKFEVLFFLLGCSLRGVDGEILFAVQERRNANQRRNVPRRTRGGLKGAVVQALH